MGRRLSQRPRRPRRQAPWSSALLAALVALGLAGCRPGPEAPLASHAPEASSELPSILLITLDTTRADYLGYETGSDATPHLDALAARGIRFSQAYSTVPTTLPSHISMMTGLYPAEHGIHENARTLGDTPPLIAEALQGRGYSTGAFVSGLPLASRFGLARGFDHYDDAFAAEGATERSAAETSDRAIQWLAESSAPPHFLWVHYFDPHHPYEPPEPFRSRFASDPYLGEIAYMDHHLGRLVAAFEQQNAARDVRILISGDHGEGLGEHGERFHGSLLYQGVMRVPLLVAGSGIAAQRVEQAVSIRQIHDTIRSWVGEPAARALTEVAADTDSDPVLAEALKPFRQYGWQPQVMAVRDHLKVIRSGAIEVYDLASDPNEETDLAGQREIDPALRQALRSYPVELSTGGESTGDSEPELSAQDQQRLASLGYVDWRAEPVLQENAPSARHMTHLFDDLDLGSGLFVERRYEEAIPVFERVLESDPGNLMVHLRLAVAHSVAGRDARAEQLFEQARELAPWSVDVRHYHGLHLLRAGRWGEAEPLLASVLAEMPNRLPTLEGLVEIERRKGDPAATAELLERIVALQDRSSGGPSAGGERWAELGEARMAKGQTRAAITAFEQAQSFTGKDFTHSLELGVLYLADRQPEAARDLLDRVEPSHPGYPMALFKRAQVSALLSEPDRAERIRRAYQQAPPDLRRLIENEALFRGIGWR
ncbi:MAG: sulfatase-like hydrolase/transferase [Acidobacteriota bacterium]